MSALFEDLKEGLQESIDYERGKGTAKRTTYVIDPVKRYSNVDIKKIRNRAGMTQAVFADYLGVSPKTIEAWELGRTHPTGPANRLLDILAQNKQDILPFVKMK